MKSIDTISVPSIWSKMADDLINRNLREEKKEKERDVADVLAQGGVLFNTHTTVVNGVMYVTYVLTK